MKHPHGKMDTRISYDTTVASGSSSFHCNPTRASLSYTTQQVHAKIQQLCQTDDDLAARTSKDLHYRCSELDIFPSLLSLDQIDETLPSYAQNLPAKALPSESATSYSMNIVDNLSQCSLSELSSTSSQAYPVVVISPGGLITVLLNKDVSVEMTMDRSIRVVNHRHRSVAAVNRIGDLSCIHHQSAKLYHDGTVTEASIYWQRRVRMASDGLVFAYGVPCFMLSPTHGLVQTTHTFQDLSRDMSVTVLFTSRGYGPHLVELLEALVRNAHYDYHPDGSVTVEINKCLIKQAPNGDVTVSSEDNEKLIRVSPDTGSVCVNTSFCEMSVQMNYNVKVKRGRYRLNASYNGMVVTDGIHESGFTSSQRPFLRPVVSTTETIIKDGKRVTSPENSDAMLLRDQPDLSRSASSLSIQSCYRFEREVRHEPLSVHSSLSHITPTTIPSSMYLSDTCTQPSVEAEAQLIDRSYLRNSILQQTSDFDLNPYSFWNNRLNMMPFDRKLAPRHRRRLTQSRDSITPASEALSTFRHDAPFQRRYHPGDAENRSNQMARESYSSRQCDVSISERRILLQPATHEDDKPSRSPSQMPRRPQRIDFSSWYPNKTWQQQQQQRPKRQYKLGRAHVYPPPGNEETRKRFYGYITSSCTTLKPHDERNTSVIHRKFEKTDNHPIRRETGDDTQSYESKSETDKLTSLRDFSASFIHDTIDSAADLMSDMSLCDDVSKVKDSGMLDIHVDTSNNSEMADDVTDIDGKAKQVTKYPSTSCCKDEASDEVTEIPVGARSKSMPYISIREQWPDQVQTAKAADSSRNPNPRVPETDKLRSTGCMTIRVAGDEIGCRKMLSSDNVIPASNKAIPCDNMDEKCGAHARMTSASGAGEGISVSVGDARDSQQSSSKAQKRRGSKKQRQRSTAL